MVMQEAELSMDEKILLEILEKQRKLSSKELYLLFRQKRRGSFQEFKRSLIRLCSKGFVRSIGDKRWRKYEFSVIQLDENDEVDSHLPEWVKLLMEAFVERSSSV